MNYKNYWSALFLIVGMIQATPERILVQPDTSIKSIQERWEKSELKPHVYFDLHGVLVDRNIKKGLYNFYFKGLSSWYDRLSFVVRVVSALLNFKLIYKIAALARDKKNPGRKVSENYYNLIRKYHSEILRDHLLQISNEIYFPNDEILETLTKLEETGCNLHILSNGGYDSIRLLKEDPRFEKLFGSNGFFTENSINNKEQEFYEDSKPNPASYEKALQRYNADKDNAIMIDDSHKKIKNCDWAARIWYKNPLELQKALIALGII